MGVMAEARCIIFDLDGTLIDSDRALIEPFLQLGVPLGEVTFGHPVRSECERLGFSVEEYLAAYDAESVQPFPGVAEMLDALARWSICSNKARTSGLAELRRLGWAPETAWFAEDFGWQAKELTPVLDALGVAPEEVCFVGDTAHDQQCAVEVGCRFAWAGWNPRTLAASPEGVVLARPGDLFDLVDLRG